MNFKNPKYLAGIIITFVILFLMNYIGSHETDRLSRALLTAFAGSVGLTIGLWMYSRGKNDSRRPPDFD